MFLMHWITIRLSRQENICVSCVLCLVTQRHDACSACHVTRLWPGARSDCDWELWPPGGPGCGTSECRARGHRGADPAHQATHFLPISTRLYMGNRRLVFWANCCNKLTQQHFSFPFKMTNDILSPVGQNRMQQCRDNISRVISGHWKQTISWAESYTSTSCPARNKCSITQLLSRVHSSLSRIIVKYQSIIIVSRFPIKKHIQLWSQIKRCIRNLHRCRWWIVKLISQLALK